MNTKYEHKSYENESVEVKQILIGVEEYRLRKVVSNTYIGNKQHLEALFEQAERTAKFELLKGLEKFIKTEQIEEYLLDGLPYVEAKIYLPFVKDEKVKNLELRIKNLERLCDEQYHYVSKLSKENEQLKLPWWKKLFNREFRCEN